MPLRIPAEVTGLEASVQAAAKRAGRNLKLNLGTNAKSIEGLSQPLGRITGKADQFTKSMEAANARVLAFGASVGVLNAVTQGFKDLVTTTIEVEKSMAAINAILGKTTGELNRFKGAIFDVARNTEQSFATVAEAALELSRQGLSAEEVTGRLNDALILARLSGQGAAEAVAGLTSAINGFKKSGITSTQVVNKFSEAAKNAAVSERDLAEAFKRAGAVAGQAGVSFDELAGIVSAVQQKTSRGGAVIGNSFKTIFTRLQSLDKLETMQNLGVQVTDASGEILNATQLIKNLAASIQDLPEAKQLQIAEDLVGKFQVAPFVSILEDFNDQQSIAIKLTQISQNASTAAYERNEALNKTLAAAINSATVNLKELFDTLGKIGVTDQLKTIVGFFSGLAENINKVLEGDSIGSKFAKGIVKGIGNVLSGPGLAIFGAIILKLTADLAKFGVGSLQTFFGINKAAKEQATLQGQIASTLLNNKGVQDAILAIERKQISAEEKKAQQTKFFTTALREQLSVMQTMQGIAAKVAPGVMASTRGRGAFGRGAGGFIPSYNAVMGYAPNFAAESSDIARGVGGAPRSARAVAIPNFNFGGGQRGTMVANTSEFMVPNFAGTGGTAIFNQNMVSSMGMPAGAKSIGAAGGFIPNFAVGPAGALRGAGITNMEQFRALSGTGATRVIGGVKVTEAQAKNVFGRGGGQSILEIPGARYGVAAMFPSKKTDITSANLAGSESVGAQELLKRGFTGIRFSGVQVSDLQTMQRNMKRGMSETENRRKIGRLFAAPLLQYGSELVDIPFNNDEALAIDKQLNNLIKKNKSAGLFSTSVEGGIFESAIRMVTQGAKSIKEFKSHEAEREPFDFEEGGRADQAFRRSFGFTDSLFRADGKRTASNSAVQSLIFKALNDPSERKFILARATRAQKKRGRAAGGYIPNFAMGALDQAIARESAAGLPINQIRINQDSSLRNAGNPMGLAVTNMRDEPTGAIPNAAKGFIPNYFGAGMQGGIMPLDTGANQRMAQNTARVAASAGGGRGAGDLLTKIFAVQAAFMMLTPVMGEMTNQSKAMSAAMTALNVAMSAAFVTSSFGIKNVGRFATGRMGADILSSASASFAAGGGARGLIGKGAGAQSLNLLKGLGGAVTRVLGPLGLLAAAAVGLSKAFEVLSGRAAESERRDLASKESQVRFEKQLGKLNLSEELEGRLQKESLIKANKLSQRLVGTSATTLGKIQDATLAEELGLVGGEGLLKGLGGGLLNIAEGIARQTPFIGDRSTGPIGTNVFPGDDEKARQTLNESIARALANPLLGPEGGGRTAQVNAIIDTLFEAGQTRKGIGPLAVRKIGPMSEETFEGALKQLDNIGAENFKKVADEIARSIPQKELEAFGKQLAFEAEVAKLKVSQEKKEVQIAKVRKSRPDLVPDNAAQIFFPSAFREGGIDGGVRSARQDIEDRFGTQFRGVAAKELAANLGESLNLEDMAAEELRLANQEFKRRVEFAKEMAKLNKASLEDAEDSLTLLQSEEPIRKRLIHDAEKKVMDEKTSVSINNAVLDTVGKIVNLGKALDVTKKDEADLLKLINGLTGDQANLESARLDLLTKAEGIVDKQGRELRGQIDGLFDALAVSKANLVTDNDRLKAKKDLNEQIRVENLLLQISAKQAERVANANRATADLKDRGAIDKELLFQQSALANARPNVSAQRAAELEILRSRIRQGDLETQLGRRDLDRSAASQAIGVLGGSDAMNTMMDNLFGQTASEIFSGLTTSQTLKQLEKTRKDLAKALIVTDKIVTHPALSKALNAGLSALIENILGVESGLKISSDELDRAADSSKLLNLAALRLKENLQTQNLSDLLINQADSIFTGRAEQRFRGKTGASAFGNARILQNTRRQREFFNRNFSRDERGIITMTTDKGQALSDLRRLNETNQLSDSLITASETFAQNIGSAMVDAIARGGDLGDALMSAAANFAGMMSQALMQSAVNDIVGGTGIGGIMGGFADFFNNTKNSGGMIRGGSGTRDDVPTLLTGGEFVMRKSAVQRYGPEFMAALNAGRVGGMQTGGMFTPGTFGQGAITGKSNLLSFATQSFTGGAFDRIGGGGGLGFASLEPQSGRLTSFGRANSPMFQREQESKRAAFGLFVRQEQLEQQERERAKQQRKGLLASVIGLVAATALKGVTNKIFNKIPKPNPNQKSILSALPVGGASSVLSRGGSLGARSGISPQNIIDLGDSRGGFDFDYPVLPMLNPDGTDTIPLDLQGMPLPDPLKRATGGYVSPRAGIDNVPSMLSGGEFVMNAAATQRIGAGNLAAANAGGGGGEGKEAVVARLDELIAVTQNSGETVINITVNSDGSENQEGGGDEQQQGLAKKIKDVVKQTIDDEKRLGGSLRRV